MNAEQLTKILATKGQFTGLTVNRPAKLRAAFGGENVRKLTNYVVQFGVQYEKKSDVKEKRAEGIEAQALADKGYKYVIFPYLAQSLTTGQLYVAANPVSKVSETWMENNAEVSKEQIASKLLASETKEGQLPQWMFIKLENVESIR
jgi:hypothetical protein